MYKFNSSVIHVDSLLVYLPPIRIFKPVLMSGLVRIFVSFSVSVAKHNGHWKHYYIQARGCLIGSALNSGASGLGSSPGRGHCVMFLGKTLYCHGASLHLGV